MRELVKAPSGAQYEVDPALAGVIQFPTPVKILKEGEEPRVQLHPAQIPWEDVRFLAALAWREELIERVRNADPVLFPALAAMLIGEARDGR